MGHIYDIGAKEETARDQRACLLGVLYAELQWMREALRNGPGGSPYLSRSDAADRIDVAISDIDQLRELRKQLPPE